MDLIEPKPVGKTCRKKYLQLQRANRKSNNRSKVGLKNMVPAEENYLESGSE